MSKLGSWMGKVLSLLLMLSMVACGGGRELTAISVSPSSADAQGRQVQFVATGTFSQSPRTAQLTSADIGWCVGSSAGSCNGNIAGGAIVDSNGLAQCQLGFQGTVTLLAGKAKTAQVNPDQGYPLRIFGAAQLTCP
jgi:hypothetical protein